MVVSLSGGVFELRTATGSEGFTLSVCLGANKFVSLAVPDPDLEIRKAGGGGGQAAIPSFGKWGAGSPKKFFRLFRPQFGLKIREGGSHGPLP